MIVGVKLGSKTLTNGNGVVYENFIEHVCRQIVHLKRQKKKVFLVTSGAVACDPCKKRSKNLRAAIGQRKLLSFYSKYLNDQGMEPAQFLLTDKNIKAPYNSVIYEVLMEALRDDKTIPIINANDVVDGKELRALEVCADNDLLFKYVCLLLGADSAIIGIDRPGFCDYNGMKMTAVNQNDYRRVSAYISNGNSLGHGHDGMRVKVDALFELAAAGIHSMLANTNVENFIIRAVQRDDKVGTVFV
jgi:glutamate 5-kinase